MSTKLLKQLGAATLSVLGLLGFCGSGMAAPIQANAFLSPFERIGFDELANGSELSFQLSFQGVQVRARDGRSLRVLGGAALAGALPKSSPHALAVSTAANATGGELEILFSFPRKKVGLYLGQALAGKTAVLQAYGASGALLDSVTVLVPIGAAANNASTFIGLGLSDASIRRVTLGYQGLAGGPRLIDDLTLEPAQSAISVASYKATLLSTAATAAQKLAAVAALQLRPCAESSQALQQAARVDANNAVREAAILALAQIRDPAAIPTLAQIGKNPPNAAIRLAAYNAVYALRKDFPLPGTPAVNVRALDPIRLGQEFTLEVSVVFPVNRANVRMRFAESEKVRSIRSSFPSEFFGAVAAGQPIVLKRRVLAEKSGQTALPFTIRVSLDAVDASTLRVPLYIDIQPATGSVSLNPFPGWNAVVRHILTRN